MLQTYLRTLVKNSKPIAGNENSTLPRATFSVKRRVLQISRNILGKIGKLVQPIVRRDGQQDSAFRWVVTECPGRDIRAAELAHAEKTDVRTRVDIIRPYVFVPDVVHGISVKSKSRALTLQLEDDETIIVTFS